MTLYFRNSERPLSEMFATAAAALPTPRVTLREILLLLGEQGLLVICAVMATPFLLPVTVPMMSVVFGIPMMLIAIGVTLNRTVLLPEWLLNRSLPTDFIHKALDLARRMAAAIEHLVHRRWLTLTASPAINVIHGLALGYSVLLLMAPVPLVPFSNTFPAVAVLLLCLGIMERDGVIITVGYLMALVATIYLAGTVAGLYYVGQNAWEALQVFLADLRTRSGL